MGSAHHGRTKVLVHNHCYHGTVDETFAELDDAGAVIDQPGNTGPPVPVRETTRVVEINDLDGLERELAHGDVALCLFEPALTNIGIVLPGARVLGRRPGAMRPHRHAPADRRDAHDQRGAGRRDRAWDLRPDIVTIGKTSAPASRARRTA